MSGNECTLDSVSTIEDGIEVLSVHVQPLDLPMLVESELLGSVSKARFAEHAADLHLPLRSAEGGLSAPPPVGDRDVSSILADERWGSVYDQRKRTQAELNGLAFTETFRCSPFPADFGPGNTIGAPELDDLSVGTKRWFERWLWWCGALTSQAIHLFNPGTATPSPRSSNPGRWVLFDGARYVLQCTPIHIDLVNNAWMDLGIHSERPVNAAVLAYAVDRANAGDDVPLALELRSNAHIACRMAMGRMATVEVGTAAESWLASVLQLPPDHGRTLGGLVTDAEEAGLPIPPDSRSGLVAPRNDAIHRGGSPDQKTTLRALEIAENIWRLSDATTHDMVAQLRRTSRPKRLDLVFFTP